ncbi:MAG: PDZ domain-containing protein [Candidatus Obscuribacterales bacterium]|nr:PDZ domain-containing protein [Candidatus Obscuribacterales bacterium]
MKSWYIRVLCLIAILIATLSAACLANDNSHRLGDDIKFSGVGLTIVEDANGKQCIIGGFVPDSPASRSIFKEGDEIVQIDGKLVEGLKMIASLLRGPANTTVEIIVRRDGQLITAKLIRAEIVIHQTGGMCKNKGIKD